jgi:outer membrane lipoprotein carrier protein
MDSAKFWRRRRPAPIDFFVTLAVVAASLFAAPAKAQENSDRVATLEAFLADVHTLQADFKQELWSADKQLIETQTGTLLLERPNRFRWRYVEPTELLVVADGKKVWMYDAELAQVTVAPVDESIASSPALLLSGDRNVRDSFDVVETYASNGLSWVKLAPKVAGGDFSSVSIGFAGKAPRRLELVDGLNQTTKIELSNLVMNPEIPQSEFHFEPPPGVDVIGNGA